MFKLELRPYTKYHQQALGIPCMHTLSSRLSPTSNNLTESHKRVFPELQSLKIDDFIHQQRLEPLLAPLLVQVAQESQPRQNRPTTATQNLESAIFSPTFLQASAIPLQALVSVVPAAPAALTVPIAPATNNSKLTHVLVQITSQQGKLPAHQKIAVLDQLCHLADSDFSRTRAVLELALVLNGHGRPKGTKNKPKRKALQHEASTQ